MPQHVMSRTRSITANEAWAAPTAVDNLRIADEIPIISIAAILEAAAGSAEREGAAHKIAEQLRAACESTGFYHITGFDALLSESTVQAALAACQNLFAAPTADKERWMHNNTKTGYCPIGSQYQLPPRSAGSSRVESFVLSNIASACAAAKGEDPSSHEAIWPHDLGDEWMNAVTAYRDGVQTVALTLIELLSRALGEGSDHFAAAMRPPGPMWRLRLCHYPPADDSSSSSGGEQSYGMAPHVDTSIVTMIASAEANGAPGVVLYSELLGGWVRAPVRPGALLVNTGETLRAVSNDTWPSTRHFVLNPSQADPRYSLAFFLHAAPNHPMAVAPSKSTASNPARYVPTTFLESMGEGRRPGLLALAG